MKTLDGEDTPTDSDWQPEALSPSDPGTAWTTRGRHKVMFAYSLSDLINDAQAIIVDVEVTPARISKEVAAASGIVGGGTDGAGSRW